MVVADDGGGPSEVASPSSTSRTSERSDVPISGEGGGRPGLLVLDVDGTIAGVAGVYPEAITLLRRCTRLRVPVALCSARPTSSLIVLAGEHACISHVAGLQGSHVCRLGDPVVDLMSTTIDSELAAGVGRRADAAGIELWWYAQRTWFVASWTEAVRSESQTVGIEPVVVDGFGALPDPNKILLIDPEESARTDLRRFVESSGMAWRSSGHADLEVISGAVNGAKGLDVIAADLGVGLERVVAVGDGANDVGMLAMAGTGFALPPLADTPSAEGFTRLPPARRGGLSTLAAWLSDPG